MKKFILILNYNLMFNKKLKNQIKYLELENAFLTSVLLFIFSFILFSIIFFNTYLN